MTDSNRMLLRDLAVIGFACLAVAACSPQQGELGDNLFPHAKWKQIPQAKDNMVEVVTLQQVLAFSGSEPGLGPVGRQALDDFINSNGINARDQIVIQGGANSGDRLTKSRIDAIQSEFAQRGLVASEGQAEPSTGGPASNEVAVLITRAVVIPPDCSVPQPEPTLRPEQPWGCSVDAALGMMVADPLDLVQGENLGPADGEQASGALRRYREDKVKELNKEETTN
jgi:pilus assembly protein CpaD